MTKVVQTQEAKDNANQLQAHTMYVTISGADEKRVREIFNEMYDIAKRDLSEIAIKIANERVAKFEDAFVPKITKIDGAINSLADPSFQLLLTEAHKTAAATEREADYDLLSELLVHRIKKVDDRKVRLGISEAVKIVDKIDDDALLGLTLAYSVNIYPLNGNIYEGLNILEENMQKLMYDELPKGRDWIEHLDILKTIRISQFGKFKKIEEIYIEQLNGYACVGIKKDSEEYKKAIEFLKEIRLSNNILIEHELNDGYVRLALASITNIENINELRKFLYIKTGDEIKEEDIIKVQENLLKIYALYSDDKSLKKKIEEKFLDEWDKRPSLLKFKQWWNFIPNSFDITSVGNVLAHANAEKYIDKIQRISE